MPRATGVSAISEDKMKEKKINVRYITSVVYVVVLLGLITLKWLVADWGALGFDALFLAISVIGCVEFFNAVKVVPLAQRALAIAFCATAVPLYALCSMMGMVAYLPVLIAFAVYCVINLIYALVAADGSDLKSTLLCFLAMVYCGVLCCILTAVNHLEHNSAPAVILMFFSVMLTDSFAYAFGKLLKRFIPLRLAPKISPNKTVIGALGGLVGGVVAGVASYYIWFGLSKVCGEPVVINGGMPALAAFILIGFVLAIVGQAGDLAESFLKRRCGIKDSGKIIPGHGGVLDRFDSLLFVGVITLISFILFTV